VCLALAAAAATVVAIGEAAAAPRPTEVCRIQGQELVESSGLVVDSGSWVSTNDSGDSARLFVLDPATCAVLREVIWSDAEPDDVEALAPGPVAGQIWVGDIGDNNADRDAIALTLVDLADGSVLRQRTLRYPEGARDAEALAAVPGSGQLVVISKEVLGGTAYVVPDSDEELVPQGAVTGLADDAAFLSADRLVVRTYTEAILYSWPELTELDRMALPEQEQGEALAVSDGEGSRGAGSDGESAALLVTSEGLEQPVWRVPLPPSWAATAAPANPATTDPATADPATADASESAQPTAEDQAQQLDRALAEERERRGRRMLVTGVLALIGIVVLLRALRPR